jgi:hypothetical protein
MASNDLMTQAGGYASALGLIVGEKPAVVENGDSVKIVWDEIQVQNLQSRLSDIIDTLIKPKTGPGVSVEVLPVIIPVLLKKFWPYIVGSIGAVAAGSFFAGRKTK